MQAPTNSKSRRTALSRTCQIELKEVVKDLSQFNGAKQKSSSSASRSPSSAKDVDLIELFARETKFLRSSHTKAEHIIPTLLSNLGIPANTPLGRAGAEVARLVSSQGNQPDYHDECHTIEVVCAAYILGRREGLPWLRIGELLVAAACHDLGHTGEKNSFPFERETASFEIAHPILVGAGLKDTVIERIRHMVLATDFGAGVPPARQSYLETRDFPAGSEPRLLATQSLLLIEADVLFSCFDLDYNDLLSRLLSAEWKRDDDTLPLKERVGFLSMVQFVTEASQELGLEERRVRLLETLRKTLEEQQADPAPAQRVPQAG